MIHELKVVQPFYYDLEMGRKTWELRKNDRDFKVGDILLLQEWAPEHGYYGSEISKRIIHVADVGSYLPGFVLLSMVSSDEL